MAIGEDEKMVGRLGGINGLWNEAGYERRGKYAGGVKNKSGNEEATAHDGECLILPTPLGRLIPRRPTMLF